MRAPEQYEGIGDALNAMHGWEVKKIKKKDSEKLGGGGTQSELLHGVMMVYSGKKNFEEKRG